METDYTTQDTVEIDMELDGVQTKMEVHVFGNDGGQKDFHILSMTRKPFESWYTPSKEFRARFAIEHEAEIQAKINEHFGWDE